IYVTQESVGFIFSISSMGSLLGAILYQYALKEYAFRNLLFWTQLIYGLSGMLDLVLVLRWNLKFGIADYVFVVIFESIAQMTNRLKWMPMLVLSSKLCPSGIEGTFFALLMSIDNVGLLSAAWGGGFVLHILRITRTRFDNIWLAILIRNILRITPLWLLLLVPRADHNSSILPITETVDSEVVIEICITIAIFDGAIGGASSGGGFTASRGKRAGGKFEERIEVDAELSQGCSCQTRRQRLSSLVGVGNQRRGFRASDLRTSICCADFSFKITQFGR
ncbi:probable folate-biopterin transporter 2, partial [Vigna umbellata]|uniref:probable folate-biopterin transporter 2 n=1 Tax=Vigna umbellata TaxID=87088 RepID=UPI001F5F9AB9